MARIEDFVSADPFATAEAEAEQDGAFAAWLKSRGAASPDRAEWADKDAEEASALADGCDDRSVARTEG